jgi:hypothetical protein
MQHAKPFSNSNSVLRAWRCAAVEAAVTERTGRRTDPKADEWSTRLLSREVSGFGFVHGPWPSSIDDGRLGAKGLGRASCGLAAICLQELWRCAAVPVYSIQQPSLQLLYYCNDRSESIGFSCPRNPTWAAIAAVLVWFPLLGSGQCSLFSEPFRRFHRRCMVAVPAEETLLGPPCKSG